MRIAVSWSITPEITKNMVGRVLTNRGIVKRDVTDYELLGFDKLSSDEVQQLTSACDRKLAEYVAKRGDAIWEHRWRKRRLHQRDSAV